MKKVVKIVGVIVLAVLILWIAALVYRYNFTVHDYSSCIDAGGQAEQNNELFFCRLNGKNYWNYAPAGTVQ